jgi:hypothetical protein
LQNVIRHCKTKSFLADGLLCLVKSGNLIVFHLIASQVSKTGLGVRGQEVKHVKDTLAAMYSDFPDLEEKARATRQAPKSPLAEARGDPFNEAADRHQKLRYLLGQPDRYKQE